jgi:hypothetical protein
MELVVAFPIQVMVFLVILEWLFSLTKGLMQWEMSNECPMFAAVSKRASTRQ